MDDKETILLVFVTACLDNRGKQSNLFLKVSREEFESDEEVRDEQARHKVYNQKSIKCHLPGTVYQIEAHEGGKTIYPGTARFVGPWKHEAQRLKWQMVHRAFLNEQQAKAIEKKESTKNLLAEALEPVKELYHRLPHARRQGLLAAVLYYITK